MLGEQLRVPVGQMNPLDTISGFSEVRVSDVYIRRDLSPASYHGLVVHLRYFESSIGRHGFGSNAETRQTQ